MVPLIGESPFSPVALYMLSFFFALIVALFSSPVAGCTPVVIYHPEFATLALFGLLPVVGSVGDIWLLCGGEMDRWMAGVWPRMGEMD